MVHHALGAAVLAAFLLSVDRPAHADWTKGNCQFSDNYSDSVSGGTTFTQAQPASAQVMASASGSGITHADLSGDVTQFYNYTGPMPRPNLFVSRVEHVDGSGNSTSRSQATAGNTSWGTGASYNTTDPSSPPSPGTSGPGMLVLNPDSDTAPETEAINASVDNYYNGNGAANAAITFNDPQPPPM